MPKCELVNPPDKSECHNEATKRIKLTIHSGIYAQLTEVENRYKYYNCCDEHLKKLQTLERRNDIEVIGEAY